MSKPRVTPRDAERPFEMDELFFSTTDRRGVIRSGNDVFARVSGFDQVEDLIGKPHNIIRHPDLPRAVFKLLWDYLEAGKPFAGYVKNLATDGCYYWVMALVVPVRDGYLSVRFKPSGTHFATAKELYAEMLRIEQDADGRGEDRRTGMRLADERLAAVLRDGGFADYDGFIYAALAAEMSSRRATLAARSGRGSSSDATASAAGFPGATMQGEPADGLRATLRTCLAIDEQLEELFAEVESFLDLIGKLETKSSFLLDLSRNVHLVSLNGQIASYRLGQIGAGLAAVTHNLSSISKESTAVITEMTEQLSPVSPLRETAFALTAAKLQVEMTILFARELLAAEDAADGSAGRDDRTRADIRTLVDSFSHSTERMLDVLARARLSIASLLRLHRHLYAMLRELSGVRVTGKVQASYITGDGHFGGIFDEVSEQLQVARRELQEFSDRVPYLQEHLPRFEDAGRSIQGTLVSLA